MFTVKIEDFDGNCKLFSGEEVKYREDTFQTLDELEEIHNKYTSKDFAGTFYNYNMPQTEEKLAEIKQEIYKYYRSGNTDSKEDYNPVKEMHVRSACIELFNDPGYTNVAVFASMIYIMNAEGQTVDTVDLLR